MRLVDDYDSGSMADYYADIDRMKEFERENEPVWTTASGGKLKISEMSQEHITNIIKRLKKRKAWCDSWIKILDDQLAAK